MRTYLSPFLFINLLFIDLVAGNHLKTFFTA